MKKLLPFICIFILFANCSKKPEGSPGKNEIWLEYKAFNPSQLIVTVGTTVTFTNKDNADHSVVATNGAFSSGRIATDNTFTYTFNTAGTVYFTCNYHSSNSSEQGAILVQ